MKLRLTESVYIVFIPGGGSSEDSGCPSVESLVNWLLEHVDDSAVIVTELTDEDSDMLFDDSWSDQDSPLSLTDTEVPHSNKKCYCNGSTTPH